MKVQVVKFPPTPDEALQKVAELRSLIEKAFTESIGGNTSALANEMIVIMWHSAMLDFIEVLDGDKRVGLLMTNIYHNDFTGKRIAQVVRGYIEPEYRQQGYFKKMLEHARLVYQARSVDYIDMVIEDNQVPITFGNKIASVYRLEL